MTQGSESKFEPQIQNLNFLPIVNVSILHLFKNFKLHFENDGVFFSHKLNVEIFLWLYIVCVWEYLITAISTLTYWLHVWAVIVVPHTHTHIILDGLTSLLMHCSLQVQVIDKSKGWKALYVSENLAERYQFLRVILQSE